MNDPHVEALVYVVEHDNSSDYSLAKTVEIEHTTFRLKLEGGEARFELKEHYPTWKQAQRAIQPFIQQWELRSSLESGTGTFTLKFKRHEMIDRNPTPGVISASGLPISSVVTISRPTVTVSRQYPQPPPERSMDIHHSVVQQMLNRYMGYRQGNEPLPGMAYFCCEVFAKHLGKDDKDAATKHKISHNLIKKVKNLASNKGGDKARHAHAISQPLAPREVQFLEKAVAAMIIRAAIVAADPNQPMDTIDGSNLLEMSP